MDDEEYDSFCGFTDDSVSSCGSGHGTESCNSCEQYIQPETIDKMRRTAHVQSINSADEETVSVPNKITNGLPVQKYEEIQSDDDSAEDGDDEDEDEDEDGDEEDEDGDEEDQKDDNKNEDEVDSESEKDYEKEHNHFLKERPGYGKYFYIYFRGDRSKIPEAVSSWPDLEQACDYEDERVDKAVDLKIENMPYNHQSSFVDKDKPTPKKSAAPMGNSSLKNGFKPAPKKPAVPVPKMESEMKDEKREIKNQFKQTTSAPLVPKRKPPPVRVPPRSHTPPPSEVDPKKKLETLLRKGTEEENNMEALSIFVEARIIVGEINQNNLLNQDQYTSLLFIIAKLLIVRSIENDRNVKEDLKQAKDILTELTQLTGDKKNLLYVWTRLLKAQLAARWNEHAEVIAECERMNDLLVRQNATFDNIEEREYPNSEKVIKESGTENLVKVFEKILKSVNDKMSKPLIDCKAPFLENEQLPTNIHWPHPRSPTRTVMFEDDPDRDDFVKFICTSNCHIEYHAKCWERIQKLHQHMKKDAMKAEDVGDGLFKCLTPDCYGFMLRAEVCSYDSVSKQYRCILVDKGKPKAVKRSDKKRHHEKLPKQRGMNKKFHLAPRPLVTQTENLSGRISPSSSLGSVQETENQSFPIDKPQSSSQKRLPPDDPNRRALPLKSDEDKDLELLLANGNEPKKKSKKKYKTKNIISPIVIDSPRPGARSGDRQAAAYMEEDQPGPSNVPSGKSTNDPKMNEDLECRDYECVICHDPLDMPNVELDTCQFCQKKVHKKCLNKWLETKPICPQGICTKPWKPFINSPLCKCSICFEPKLATDDLTTLHCHCRNDFHTKCIRKWLTQNSVCPLCNKHALMEDEYPML